MSINSQSISSHSISSSAAVSSSSDASSKKSDFAKFILQFPLLSTTEKSQNTKVVVKEPYITNVKSINQRFNNTFTPILNKVALYGSIYKNYSLIDSLFFYLQVQLNIARLSLKDELLNVEGSRLLLLDIADIIYNYSRISVKMDREQFVENTIEAIPTLINLLKEFRSRLELYLKSSKAPFQSKVKKTTAIDEIINTTNIIFYILQNQKELAAAKFCKVVFVSEEFYNKSLESFHNVVHNLLTFAGNTADAGNLSPQRDRTSTPVAWDWIHQTLSKTLEDFDSICKKSFTIKSVDALRQKFDSLHLSVQKYFLEHQQSYKLEQILLVLHKVRALASRQRACFLFNVHPPQRKLYDFTRKVLDKVLSKTYLKNSDFPQEKYSSFINARSNFQQWLTNKRREKIKTNLQLLVNGKKSEKVFISFINNLEKTIIQLNNLWKSFLLSSISALEDSSEIEVDWEFIENLFLAYDDIYLVGLNLSAAYNSYHSKRAKGDLLAGIATKESKKEGTSAVGTSKRKKRKKKKPASKSQSQSQPPVITSPAILSNDKQRQVDLEEILPVVSPSPIASKAEAKRSSPASSSESFEEISSGKSRKYRNFVSKLSERGWKPQRAKGDHIIFKHPNFAGSISVPRHNTIKLGTARSILQQILELSPKQEIIE